MRIILDHGLVYNSDQKSFLPVSVLIENGFIVALKDVITDRDTEYYDLSGHYILPGLIDLHSHLREPGETYKETIHSGSLAAAKGGYTRIVAMANTKPPVSNQQVYDSVNQIIQKDAVIHVTQAGTITEDLAGKKLSPLMQNASLPVYSDDGKGIDSVNLLREALIHAKEKFSLLILHEEDSLLSKDGVIHDGNHSADSHLPIISSLSESAPLLRDLMIAKEIGYPLHFTHISSQASVEILNKARSTQCPYSADVTPHHLFFSDELINYSDANFKMKPPIRSESDRKSLIQSLCNGTIQAIATDHAPHSYEEKKLPFLDAPFGVIGFETAFAACYTKLFLEEHIPLETIVPLFTSNPAQLLRLPDEGVIRTGHPANITVVSREEKYVTKDMFCSKSTNSPFIGKKLGGFPVLTFLNGKVVYEAYPNRYRPN